MSHSVSAPPLSPIPSVEPAPSLDVDLALDLDLNLDLDTEFHDLGTDRRRGYGTGSQEEVPVDVPVDSVLAADSAAAAAVADPAHMMTAHDGTTPELARVTAHETGNDDGVGKEDARVMEGVDRLEQDWPSTPNQTPSPPPMSPPMAASVLVVKRPLSFPTLTGAGDSVAQSARAVGESSLSMSISSIHSHHSHGHPQSIAPAMVVSPPLHPVHVVPVSASMHSHSNHDDNDRLPATPKSTATRSRASAPGATTPSSTSSPSPNRTATLTASKKPPLGRPSSTRPRPRSTSIPATQTPLSPTLSATSTSRPGSRAPSAAAGKSASLIHRQRRGSTSTLASATTSLYSTSTANVPAYAGAPTRPGGLVHHSIKRVSAAYEPDGMGPVPKFPDQDMARLVVRHAPYQPPVHDNGAGSEVGDSVSMIHTPRHGGSASISILTHASADSVPLFPMSSAPNGGATGHGHVCLWELGVCCHEWSDPNPSVRRTPRVCGMRFNSGDALYKHLTEHHVEVHNGGAADGLGTRCGHCHWRGCVKVFRNTSKYLRRDHFKKHITELVEYVCLDCGRVCDKEYGSGRHICRESNPLPAARAGAKGSDATASPSVVSISDDPARTIKDTKQPSPVAAPTSAAAPVALHVNNTTQHHHHHAHQHEHEGDLHVHFGDAATVPPKDRSPADDADSVTKASSSVEEWVRNDALAAIRHHQLKQQRSPLGISDEGEDASPDVATPAKLTLAALPPGISPAEFLAHHVDPALVQELARMVSSTPTAPAPATTSEWGIQTSPTSPTSATAAATPAGGDSLAHYAELATTTLAHLSTLHAQADAQAEAIQHLVDAHGALRAVPATLLEVVQALSAVAGAHHGVATRLARVEEGVAAASAAGSVAGGDGASRRPSEDREVVPLAAAASFRFAPAPDVGYEGSADESADDEEDKDDSAYASAAAPTSQHPELPHFDDLAQQTAAMLEPKLASLLDAHATQVSASHVELAARLEMLESAAARREQETAALVEHVPATIMAAVAKQLAAMEARLAGLFARPVPAVAVEKRDVATSMSPPASPKMRGWDGTDGQQEDKEQHTRDIGVEVTKSPPVSLLSNLIHQASASSLVGPNLRQASAPASPTTETASSSAAAASDILSFFTTTRSRTLERYEPKKVIVPITLATPGSPTFSTAFSLSSSTNAAHSAVGGGGSTTNVSLSVPESQPKSPSAPSRALPADTVSAPVRHRHPAWTTPTLATETSSASLKSSPVVAKLALTDPASSSTTSPVSSSSPRNNSLKRLSIVPTPPSLTPPSFPQPVLSPDASTGHLPTPQSSNSVASSTAPSQHDAADAQRMSHVSIQSAPPAALTSPVRRPLTLGYSSMIQVDIPHTSSSHSPPSPSVSPTRSMIAIPTTHHDEDVFATLRSVQSVTVGTMTIGKAKKKRGVARMWQAMARALGGGKKKETDRVSVSSASAASASGRYVTGGVARRV